MRRAEVSGQVHARAAPRLPFSSTCDFPALVEATTLAVAWLTPREACWSLQRLALSLSAFTCRGSEEGCADTPPGERKTTPVVWGDPAVPQGPLRPRPGVQPRVAHPPEPSAGGGGGSRWATQALVEEPRQALGSYLGGCHKLGSAGRDLPGTDHQLLEGPLALHHHVSRVTAGGQREGLERPPATSVPSPWTRQDPAILPTALVTVALTP